MDGVVAASVAARVPVPRSGRVTVSRASGGEGRAEFTDRGDLWTWGVMVPALDTSVGFVRHVWWSVLDTWQHKSGWQADLVVGMHGDRCCGFPGEPFTPDYGSNVELVTDELVTNAVEWSVSRDGLSRDSTLWVLWRLAAHAIYVEVRGCVGIVPGESVVSVPVLMMPDELAESGRGLWLVDAVSRDWGWFRAGDGCIAVWSVVDR